VYGVRPPRVFEQAAAKFVRENQQKRSLRSDIERLRGLMPWIGQSRIDQLSMRNLQPWVEHRREEGVTAGTINHGLKIVRRILNLAATEWVDEFGMTWLQAAPKIRLLMDRNKRPPHPLSWEEQDRMFRELPKHLAEMALFAVNTGCRDSEICGLRWAWEQAVPALNTSVFVVPGRLVKNGEDRLILLNETAKSVVNAARDRHDTHVFVYNGEPVTRMLNGAWLRARHRAGLEDVRVHDLKHTFGRRLRSAGVSFEDRQDLLGHRSGRITTHYSAPELARLLDAANKVCVRDDQRPQLVVLRQRNAA
jgi:integrase